MNPCKPLAFSINSGPCVWQSWNGKAHSQENSYEFIKSELKSNESQGKQQCHQCSMPTGLMPRWYVFPRHIWHPRPSSWSTVIPFRVPWVPTGMNTGVLTSECGSIRSQALAFVTGHSATTRRVSGEAAERAFFSDMLFPNAFESAPHSVVAAMLRWTRDANQLTLTIALTNQRRAIRFERRTRLYRHPIRMCSWQKGNKISQWTTWFHRQEAGLSSPVSIGCRLP